MIVTITPNPSLDRTLEVAKVEVGEVHRAKQVHVDPGGKGINVSKVLAAAGTETVAITTLGGYEGAHLADLLTQLDIRVAGVQIAGTTRSNVTIVDETGCTTKINEPGPALDATEFAKLRELIAEQVARAEWVVGCGSLTSGMPEDFYTDLVELAHAAGAKVAIDADGGALAKALPAGPDLIKPNYEELVGLAGKSLDTLGDVIDYSQQLCAQGVGAVLTSLGAEGAVLVTAQKHWHAKGTKVEIRSTVGAGDSTLAGFLHAGEVGPQALILAVAYGAAAVTLAGTGSPTPTDVRPELVSITEINRNLTLTGAAL
jgi:1-phosphofructokinase